jgi:acetyl esterase/lipase
VQTYCLRKPGLVVAVALLFLFLLPAIEARAAKPAVTIVRNVEYRTKVSGELLPFGNCLDIYHRENQKDAPVIVLVHGGAWVGGDKLLDFIPAVASRFVEQGFCVVAPNYRLSPLVQHPAHVQDLAQAIQWTARNISPYGGRAKRFFLVRHSAGGHLVSLAATDEQYLKAVGVSPKQIQAVVSISGVYQIADLTLNKVAPQLNLSAAAAVKSSPFAIAFGANAETWRNASPQSYLRPGLPPFLLVTADPDLPTLAEMASDFHKGQQRHGVTSQLIETSWRGHAANFWRMGLPGDSTFTAVVNFLNTQK